MNTIILNRLIQYIDSDTDLGEYTENYEYSSEIIHLKNEYGKITRYS